MPTSNMTCISLGLAYQLLPELELASRYEGIYFNGKEPQIVTVGLNYELSQYITLQIEGVFPKYHDFNVELPGTIENPDIKDASYYIIGLNYKF